MLKKDDKIIVQIMVDGYWITDRTCIIEDLNYMLTGFFVNADDGGYVYIKYDSVFKFMGKDNVYMIECRY